MSRAIMAVWLCLIGAAAAAQSPSLSPSLSPLTALCEAEPLAELLTVDENIDENAQDYDDEIRVEADQVDAVRDRAVLRGNVQVRRGKLLLRAPELTLERGANRVSGVDIEFGSPEVALRGASGRYDISAQTGVFEQTDYYIHARNARGSAASVSIDRDAGRSELSEVSYSTCARSNEFWQLSAERLALDRDSGRGQASDVTLTVGGAPVLYLPYLSFPIDDRRHSGFLTPRLGYSNDAGVDLRVPYYWNIAPNQDLTLFPRILFRRGVMFGAEYRYLGRRHRGELEFEYLPHDRQIDDDRGAIKVEHRSNPAPNLFTELLFQQVSDDDYIDDLSNNLALLSPNYLDRRFDVSYFGASWNALARVQDFQTIDADLFGSDDQPYGRLPQLLFNAKTSLGTIDLGDSDSVFAGSDFPLQAELRAELSRFDTDSDRVTGLRLDLQPTVSARLEQPWGFLEPRLGYRYTSYQLDDADPGIDDSPDRGAPVFSVDSGVFLERPVASGPAAGGLLTLEPRLFYLYVPHRRQDDIPLFDTTELDPSIPFLFLDNRFTGADRLGDANQLSAALTSRLLNKGGEERLRVSVGQALYFERPQVGLHDASPENDDSSDFFAEAALSVSQELSLRGALRWDPERSLTKRSALDLRYRPGGGRQLLNLSHRFARDDLEQLDVSFLWPLGDRWRTLGRWNYSLRESNVIDVFAGLEYDDCCWALRVLARHHRDEPDDARADNSVFVELELKGLAGVGNRIDRLLEESIFGYESVR